jgi:hypothetical protein
MVVQLSGRLEPQSRLEAVKRLMRHQTQSRALFLAQRPPHDHRPARAIPFHGSVGDRQSGGQFTGEDAGARH